MVWYFFCTFTYTIISVLSNFLENFLRKLDIMPKSDYTIQVHREVEQLAARWAHNPKVAGSSPASATNYKHITLISFGIRVFYIKNKIINKNTLNVIYITLIKIS